jgi:hypothetical protein
MSDQHQSQGSLSAACELVGRFQYHFSKIETALDLGVAKVLDLDMNAKDIVCANLDFVRKLSVIKAAGALQFPNRQAELVNLLNRVAAINEPDRQLIIHSTFEPTESGVRFLRTTARAGRLERKVQDWDHNRFTNMFDRMEGLAHEIEALVAELRFEPRLDFSDRRNSMYLPFF